MEVSLGGQPFALRVRNYPAARNSIPRGDYRPAATDEYQQMFTSTDTVGGIDSIPFIVSNADTLTLDSVFAIETVRGPQDRECLQLQYSQTALLNFRGLSFPHVTVGTLVKAF